MAVFLGGGLLLPRSGELRNSVSVTLQAGALRIGRCSGIFGAGGALHSYTTGNTSTRDTKTAVKHKTTTTTTARAPDHPNFVWGVALGFVGVGDIGQPPHKATNTPRTNRMEIQNFDNQTTGKTRSHRPPTPLTSLAEMKITAQLTITTTKHMRLLSSTGDGAAPLRWPPVAVYLRSHRWLRMDAAPAGAHVQNHARNM